jgi:hypothetical protein
MRGWRRWRDWLTEVGERRRLLKRVERTLRVPRRGGCVDDRLIVKRISTHLQVEWCARDVHPWDRDLPVERRDELFLEQCRHDTVLAVQQMFARLAEVEVIEIRVLEPSPSARTILAGTVSRHDLAVVIPQRSPRMSLKLMGIHHEANESSLGVRYARSRASSG